MGEKSDVRRVELQSQLEAGIDALVVSDGWREYLSVQARFRRYSFGNTLLILAQCPVATRVAGFRKWLELNRFVVKGSSAIWIWGPCTRRETDPATGESRTVLFAFKPVPVFDVSQT